MRGFTLARTAGVALAVYGVLGLAVAIAMVLLGSTLFDELERLREPIDRERGSLVQSLRAVSTTVGDAASATHELGVSVEAARASADMASQLAADTATSFRELAQAMQVDVFGFRPLAPIAPRFDQGAVQLTQLASTLATARGALGRNGADVARLGGDLATLQRQVDALSTSVDQAGLLFATRQRLLAFQVAFYGMCLLVALQSLFSLVAGGALLRQQARRARELAERMSGSAPIDSGRSRDAHPRHELPADG